MRKLILIAIVAAVALPFAGASADKGCNGNGHKHTAAGSCKDTDDHQTVCGDQGQLPASAGSVRVYANQTADGGEVEACNDEGAGITQGRLIVKVSDDGYARASLDSDKDQEGQVAAGYINVQAGPGAEQTGVWCSATDGPQSTGDGYGRPTNDPGVEGGSTPDQWAECIPTQ